MKVWMRWTTKQDAISCAQRLSRKHGAGRFAVVFDDLGITGFVNPYAVVSATSFIPTV